MPFFEDSIEGKKIVPITFTKARVVEAEGGLKHEEIWILEGPETVDGWNQWVVAYRLLGVAKGPWSFNRIVPWWGEYVQVQRRA